MYQQSWKRMWYFIPQACLHVKGLKYNRFKKWFEYVISANRYHIFMSWSEYFKSDFHWRVKVYWQHGQKQYQRRTGHQENMTTYAVNISNLNASMRSLEERVINLKIQSGVLAQIGTDIFNNIGSHYVDHTTGEDDHLTSLLRLIVPKYVSIKLKSYGKDYTQMVAHKNIPSKRHLLTKSVIFSHQWCELHWLPCATYSEIRHTFKQEIHVHDEHLIFSHYIPFMQMLSNQYIFPTKLFRHIINTATIRVLQKFHHHYHGDCRILADDMWICHLECHYCFTTILGRGPQYRLPLALPQNVFTPPSSGHLPATHYTTYLKMFYLDALLLH